MYDKLKKVIIIFTFLSISVIGLLFVRSNESELFAGYQNVIVVERSSVDFPQELGKFAKEHDLVLARRIVEPLNNETGQLQNTYAPIGASKLPKGLIQQKDKERINNSSYNTVYVIVSGRMNADEVARDLSKQNALVRPLSTNYETALLRLFITMPQSFLIILGLLLAYASIILTQYISSMKEVGILRISGKGKHAIALEQTYKDSVFIFFSIFFFIIGVTVSLFMLHLFSFLAFFIISLPIMIWGGLIIVINFFLSHIFYYILQHQPIILSIKGKSPVGLIFFVVTITQLFTLCSVMYSVYEMNRLHQDRSSLNVGRAMWQQSAQYYEITSLEDGGSVTQAQKEAFFNELAQDSTILYRVDTLDNSASTGLKGQPLTYEPTADLTSNVIYVNENYIKKSGIPLSSQAATFMSKMNTYDKMILIPKVQQHHFDTLKAQWTYFEERGFLPKDADFENPHPEAKMATYLYDGGDFFSYPVYSLIGRSVSNKAMLFDPIIVVEKPNYVSVSTSSLLVDNPDRTIALIRKHKVTAAYGSLTNGLYSVEAKIKENLAKQYMIVTSTGLSILTSILLFILMNRIYFYQGRKTHFLERLAGKSFLAIHKIYLWLLCCTYFFIGFLTLLLGFSYLVAIVPILYLGLLFVIFVVQLSREKRANILYLKGE